MSFDLPLPTGSATCEDRGGALRVSGLSGGPFEVRVDAGLVFGRCLSAEPRVWTPVSVSSVLAYFAANSPVATYLRSQGAVPLHQLVLDVTSAGGVDDS